MGRSWWRHQMETFSALLAICTGNSPVPGEFPAQRPVTRSFDVFFDPRLNKRLSKQSWGWWFETLLRPLWRHCNVIWSTNARYSMASNEGIYSVYFMATKFNLFFPSIDTLCAISCHNRLCWLYHASFYFVNDHLKMNVTEFWNITELELIFEMSLWIM